MAGLEMTGELRVDDDDWFGVGSSFDSGEELAAALVAFGTARPPARAAIEAGPEPPGDGSETGGDPARSALGQAPATGLGSAPAGARPAGSPPGSPRTEGRPRRPVPGGRPAGQGIDASSWPTISARAAPAPAGVPAGQASGPGWQIRQGVRSLRRAEEALERLREEAILVAWAAASAALRRARR
ncbi:MAG: hypothetical protein NVSMB29_07450 [Candidatus Dormibacteria bacterium]